MCGQFGLTQFGDPFAADTYCVREPSMDELCSRLPVPRYYFHLYDDMDVLDDEGREFPDVEAALKEAMHQARTVAGYVIIGTGRLTLSHRIEVADEAGKVLGSVCFGDVVAVAR